jgi:3-oxoacyl-(acyl-carrier-protein) synthase
MPRRVVITGVGVVCAIGESFAQFAAGISGCRPGVTWVRAPRPTGGLSGWVEARVIPPPPNHAGERASDTGYDPVTRLALRAATEALAQGGWDEERSLLNTAGLYVGTAFGGIQTLESSFIRSYGVAGQPDPCTLTNSLANATAARISSQHGSLGPSLTYSSGSVASSHAIGEAFIAIREGRLERALAGGSEACLTRGVLGAWRELGDMAPGNPTDPASSCRPFSRDRAGLVLGEGAAMFTLEALESAHQRGAPILCEVLGFGSTSAAGLTGFAHDRSLAAAMLAALEDAHLAPCDIDYIAADATGTRSGDLAEARAILQVFGPCVPRLAVSSTKALHGHLVGASGALGVAVGILALIGGFLPATSNLRERDHRLGALDFVPNVPRLAVPVRRVLCNAFSFGNANAVLTLGRSEIGVAALPLPRVGPNSTASTGSCTCQRP